MVHIKKKKKENSFFLKNYIEPTKICEFRSISSVPKGSLSIIDQLGNIILEKKISYQKIKFDKYFKSKVKNNLINYLREVKRKYGNKCIVCLSGGLDSYYNCLLCKKKIFKSTISIQHHLMKKGESLDAYHAKKIAKF